MILTAPLLEPLDWLVHGFGTRHSNINQEQMASLKQVHSASSLVAGHPGCAGEGDALIATEPGVMVSIRTADCFPILIVDTRTRAVAAVHAGWRGSAEEIVRKTVERLRSEFGTDPKDVFAAIGPGIGACCYHVGEEVALMFGRKKAGYLDLAAVNRRQLLMAGIPGDQIDAVGGCTSCEPETFHSFRRDKDQAGRMVSFIGAK
jgi:polyphenol oxidase